jgi:hypothetical protein
MVALGFRFNYFRGKKYIFSKNPGPQRVNQAWDLLASITAKIDESHFLAFPQKTVIPSIYCYNPPFFQIFLKIVKMDIYGVLQWNL